MIRKLKSGLDMEYLEDKKILRLTVWNSYPGDRPDMMPEVIEIKKRQIRSLGCMCNWVAWHRGK